MAALFSELILEIVEHAALISGIVDILSEHAVLVDTNRFIVSEMSRNSVLNELSSHSMSLLDGSSLLCDVDTDEIFWKLVSGEWGGWRGSIAVSYTHLRAHEP